MSFLILLLPDRLVVAALLNHQEHRGKDRGENAPLLAGLAEAAGWEMGLPLVRVEGIEIGEIEMLNSLVVVVLSWAHSDSHNSEDMAQAVSQTVQLLGTVAEPEGRWARHSFWTAQIDPSLLSNCHR